LNNSNEATGASNVNRSTPVPATAPTVNTATAIGLYMAFERQVTVVDEVQPEVAHLALDSDTLAVKSKPPKLRPVIVTDAEPLSTVLNWPCEIAGASKSNEEADVPAIAPSVTCTAFSVKAASILDERHTTAVLLDQDAVAQLSSST
jgi:hypothetical protein